MKNLYMCLSLVLAAALMVAGGCSSKSSSSLPPSSTGTTGTATGTGTSTGTSTGSTTGTGSTSGTGNGGASAGDEFGTVTETAKTPGNMDCKGDSISLVQGGYMRFDLSGKAGTSCSTATLRVYVTNWSSNQWRWITLLTSDPAIAQPSQIFSEIQSHSNVVSSVVTLGGTGWYEIPLFAGGVSAINAALSDSNPVNQWVAFSLAFE